MSFLDKYARTNQIMHWEGDMEADYYLYTSGRAGERFFTQLKNKGEILGTECENCDVTYVPPRIYCQSCFGNLEKNLVDVGIEGTVRTFTIARIDKDGHNLKTPGIYAIVKLDAKKDNTTGLLHKLGQAKPGDVSMGMRVKAVLKEKKEREGKIEDIKYFVPV